MRALNMPEGITGISRDTYSLHMTIFIICVLIGPFAPLLGGRNNRPSGSFERTALAMALSGEPHSDVQRENDTWFYRRSVPLSNTLHVNCVQCHGKAAMGGVNLEKMLADPSVGSGFRAWQKVAAALEEKRMPPAKLPQPSDAERAQTVRAVRTTLSAYAKTKDGDPGRVTMRRLTSGEYAYTIADLTGVEIDVGIGSSSDSAGGEGFTNFGDVLS